MQTPFENGEFTCKLRLTDSFPKEPPKGYFITKIFHPNVEPRTGEICVSMDLDKKRKMRHPHKKAILQKKYGSHRKNPISTEIM